MSETQKKKCPYCDAMIKAEAKFCPKCGKNLTQDIRKQPVSVKSRRWIYILMGAAALVVIFALGFGISKWKGNDTGSIDTIQGSGTQSVSGKEDERVENNSEITDAYMTFLNGKDYEYYALLDISGDGIPELFAAEEAVQDTQQKNSLGTGYYVNFADVYGYDDGTVNEIYTELGSNFSEICYSGTDHMARYSWGGGGWNQWAFFSLDDSMDVEHNYLSCNVDTDTYYYGPDTDDSCEISEDEYTEWMEKWDDCEKVPFQKFQPESNQDMYICVEESYESGDSGRYTYDYNRKGQRIKKTFASESDFDEWWVEYQYDDQGNLSQEETFCSGISEERIEYAYDTEEKLLQKTYFINGGSGLELDKWLKFEYDSNGDQVLEIQYSSDGEEYFRMSKEYDSDGNVIRAVYSYMNGDSETEECKYDSHGQLIECITWDADGNQMEHDKYSNEYDSHGNLIKSTVTEGYFHETTYKYQLLSEYLEEKD